VIPKTHAATILDIGEADFSAVTAAVHKIAGAVQKALNPDGINLLQLNGKAANQVVPHLHVHIVPRWSGDGLTVSQWEIVPGDFEKINGIAAQIATALQ
jgi:histidine triad (HIT) family protein